MTTTNRAFLGAYKKGYDAALAGQAADTCPYVVPTHAGTDNTYSAAFARYWHNGHRFGTGERERLAKGATA